MLRAKEKFTRNLKRIRTQKGVTQAELSMRIHTSIRYISLLENRPQNVTLDLMESIAKALNVPVERFLEPFSTEADFQSDQEVSFSKDDVLEIKQTVEKTILTLEDLLGNFNV